VASGKKLILVVIDGLTPELFERGIELGVAPNLARLAADGEYGRGVTVFPSVTPVCLASIATGAYPDTHRIPHLAWYNRDEERIVEYGSSFPAMRSAGARRSLRDGIFEYCHTHLSPQATTVFEAVEDAGLVPAAINFTCYRGRTRHPIRLPGIATRNRWYEAVYGPRRFFFFNLFESDPTGAPLAVRSRLEGSVDAYAGYVGRWLVTRDGFDLLVFYLPDLDYASHLEGPSAPLGALARADASVGLLVEAAGGHDELHDRYAVLVCSDHGQTPVTASAQLQDAYADLAILPGRGGDPAEAEVAVTASNRFGMVYALPSSPLDARALAERLDGVPAAGAVCFSEDGWAVVRRDGEELRFRPAADGWEERGDGDVLEAGRFPNGRERTWRALATPTAGEVLVSAREGFEFADLGGQDHLGGGSHGSLVAGDSTVPLVAAGFEGPVLAGVAGVTDLAPLALRQLGIEPPASMTARAAAAPEPVDA
jgi:hypothetical protein